MIIKWKRAHANCECSFGIISLAIGHRNITPYYAKLIKLKKTDNNIMFTYKFFCVIMVNRYCIYAFLVALRETSHERLAGVH